MVFPLQVNLQMNTASGQTKRILMHDKSIKNEATETEIRVSIWSSYGKTNHYYNIWMDSRLPPLASTVTAANQKMQNPQWDGLCGLQGKQMKVDNMKRPGINCGTITHLPQYPQFIGPGMASQSIFTKYNSDGFCTKRLHNGGSWESDTFAFYNNHQYHALSLSEETGEGIELVNRPKTYDVLRAEREVRARGLQPLIPRSHSRRDLERIAASVKHEPLSITSQTDEFVKLKRANTHLGRIREQFLQVFMQQDPAALHHGTTKSGRHTWVAKIVENPINEFVLINSQDQVDAQAAERSKLVPQDPLQMAQNSFASDPEVNLDEKTDPEKRGQDACSKDVLSRAEVLCHGLSNELANCIEDICMTNEDAIADVAAKGEKDTLDSFASLADSNFELGDLLNEKLAEQMGAAFAQRGVECKTVVSGEELWNLAPYDREVPAWTYDTYVQAKTLYLQAQETASNQNTTMVF